MLISLYNHLIIISIVTGGLYLILKIISKGTVKYFTASWPYCTYIVIFLPIILLPHEAVSLARSSRTVASNSHLGWYGRHNHVQPVYSESAN